MEKKFIKLITDQNSNIQKDSKNFTNLSCDYWPTQERSIAIAALLHENINPIAIEVFHNQITTQLDFTGVTNHQIWYFDSAKNFSGKTCSLHQDSGTFRVETQARYIVIFSVGKNNCSNEYLQKMLVRSFKFDKDQANQN